MCAFSTAILGCPFAPESPIIPPVGGLPQAISVETVEVASGWEFGVSLAFSGDGRIFITDKNSGKVHVVRDGTLLEAPLVDVAVNSFGQRGLLGITLDPAFSINGFLFLTYTSSMDDSDSRSIGGARDNRVVRFAVADDSVGDETVIVTLPVFPGPIHNVENLGFGPGGNLYVAMGELSVQDNAQDTNPSNPAGKILRFTPDGQIPGDNPLSADNPIYAFGLRNPFDLAFHPTTGDLWVTENGPDKHDEINRIEPAGNYGWPRVQGAADDLFGDPVGERDFAGSTENYSDPVLDFGNSRLAMAGIAINPSDRYGVDAEGDVFFAEFNTGVITRIDLSSEDGRTVLGVGPFVSGLPQSTLTGLRFSPDGFCYVLSGSKLIRIDPASE